MLTGQNDLMNRYCPFKHAILSNARFLSTIKLDEKQNGLKGI